MITEKMIKIINVLSEEETEKLIAFVESLIKMRTA